MYINSYTVYVKYTKNIQKVLLWPLSLLTPEELPEVLTQLPWPPCSFSYECFQMSYPYPKYRRLKIIWIDSGASIWLWRLRRIVNAFIKHLQFILKTNPWASSTCCHITRPRCPLGHLLLLLATWHRTPKFWRVTAGPTDRSVDSWVQRLTDSWAQSVEFKWAPPIKWARGLHSPSSSNFLHPVDTVTTSSSTQCRGQRDEACSVRAGPSVANVLFHFLHFRRGLYLTPPNSLITRISGH